MDFHERQEVEEGTGDEDDNFSSYMDDNGVIGMEDQGDLGFDEQDILTQEEQRSFGQLEQRILGLDEKLVLQLGEQDMAYPEAPSDEDRSGMQNWEEQFSFSQMAEERSQDLLEIENSRYSDIITDQHDTDGLSLEEHPDTSLSLPPPLDWRPPSRDQQLDMTEDEQDRGSSIGKLEEEDPDSYSQGQSDLPYDDSPSHERFEEYGQTTADEEQWDNPPMSSLEESYLQNPRTQEDEPTAFSLYPSPHPISNSWGSKLINQLGGLSVSPRIEDETLPESSCTDSMEGQAPISSGDFRRVAFNQSKDKQSESAYPTSTPLRTWNAGDTNMMRSSKSSTAPLYGRGQLNYPLPDFSKVGPRVKFPRDNESYRPPPSRKLDTPKKVTPVIFKSPAEIVREVLQSSTDTPIQEPIVPRTVPQEFQTPKQATELVHQLQEDYNKLLTKYAEAENTIDRLRLGAKINLYSDPPKPSHSVQMGTVLHGSKIMEFTIPQVHKATFDSISGEDGITPESPDFPAPTSPPLPEMLSTCTSPVNTPMDTPSTLSSNIELLQQELDHFEKLLNDGRLTPGEQQQALLELRGSLEVLEQQYLNAQGQYRQWQQDPSSGYPPEELDPNRVLETAIFELGVHLDDLQDKVQDLSVPKRSPELDIRSDGTTFNDPLHAAPVPSAVTPIPALLTPYPETPPPTQPPGHTETDQVLEKKKKTDLAEDLPQPLRHKQMQVEKEYDSLLSTYNNFKTLPDALGLEQDEWPHFHQMDTRPHQHAQMTDDQDHQKPDRSEHQPKTERRGSRAQSVRLQPRPRVLRQNDHLHDVSPRSKEQHVRIEESPRISKLQNHVQPVKPEPKETRPFNAHKLKASPRGQQETFPGQEEKKSSPEAQTYTRTKSAPQSSKGSVQRVSLSSPSTSQLREKASRSRVNEQSVSGDSMRGSNSRRSSISSKSVSSSAQKEKPKDKGSSAQDRIVSPETDSGFLGSESGQSPLQKQRNRLQQIREAPPAVIISSTNSPPRTESEPSRMENDKFRIHKTSWGKREEGNRWLGPSEVSSPSPGPKSLTESEGREQSQASDTDSERDRCSDIVNYSSSAARVQLSPLRDSSQHLRDISETRRARDQAIQELQKEVVQLRHHLETSLSRPSAQEKPTENRHLSNFQIPREERAPHFAHVRTTPLSNGEATVKVSRAEPPNANSTVPDIGSAQHSKGRHVYGDYTGTLYHLPETSPSHRTQQATIPSCQRCQGNRRRSLEHVRSPVDVDPSSPVPSSCPLCNESNDSADTQRPGLSNHHVNRRRQRSLKAPPFGHWILNQTPPVTYIQTPLISYSSPVMYSPSPNYYVPMGYSVPEIRPPRTFTPPPSFSDTDDLRWPLNRALEAAKELKVTSKRMCRSLTSDLGFHRNFRGSCLF
ncbi:microtubule organization protein AKNA isoform X2 [Pelobates fuscus]|uniref:microtubule organization protein AKNA isoform X2 n=1 Tax=Pelobates fuscus TaxID=191477 RepID=UPI002FE4E681